MGMCQGCKEVFNTNDMINGYCNDCVKKQCWYKAWEVATSDVDKRKVIMRYEIEDRITKLNKQKAPRRESAMATYERYLLSQRESDFDKTMYMLGGKYSKLKNWYFNINNKQRTIVWVISVLITATNPIGWIFFVWWWLPLLTYLEYNRT